MWFFHLCIAIVRAPWSTAVERVQTTAERAFVMLKRSLRFTVIGALLLCAPVLAFDGKRPGFFLGFGAGPGLSLVASKAFDGNTWSVGKTRWTGGPAANIRLGAGLSDHVSAFVAVDATFHTDIIRNGEHDERVTAAQSTKSLGLIWFAKPSAPSWSVFCGFGVSRYDRPFEGNYNDIHGFGVLGGLGYEVRRHWLATVQASWGNPNIRYQGGHEIHDQFLLSAMLNYVAY